MSDNYQISYFPYLWINDYKNIKYFGIELRDISGFLSEHTIDNNKKEHLQNLFSINQWNGKPIKNLLILKFSEIDDFRPITLSENKLVDEFRRVLFISSVASSNIHDGANSGLLMTTTENFSITHQNFKFGEPWTAYSSGSIVRIMDGGYKFGEIKFEKPPYVPSNKITYDEKLLNSLKRLKSKNRRIFRLIIRATESMMQSYYNSNDISYESRILSQARAFEILFKLPDSGQRKQFKEKIMKYCQLNSEKNLRYKSERFNKNFVWEKGSKQFMWADRFYTLRNHIIHGENIKLKDFLFNKQAHHDLALWFFIVSVKSIINESFGRNIFYDVIKFQNGKFIYDRQLFKYISADFWKHLPKKKTH